MEQPPMHALIAAATNGHVSAHNDVQPVPTKMKSDNLHAKHASLVNTNTTIARTTVARAV